MRRRKITPEVILKSTLTFFFGAAVGFGSYHITELLIERRAFADSPAAISFPKTVEELHSDFTATYEKIFKPSGPENDNLKYYYTAQPQPTPAPEQIEETITEEQDGEEASGETDLAPEPETVL